MDTVMQRDNECRRVVIAGRRTDDGTRCTVVAIHERGGGWAVYPHGDTKLGARFSGADAAVLAQTILESS